MKEAADPASHDRTGSSALAASYPSATVDPNAGSPRCPILGACSKAKVKEKGLFRLEKDCLGHRPLQCVEGLGATQSLQKFRPRNTKNSTTVMKAPAYNPYNPFVGLADIY